MSSVEVKFVFDSLEEAAKFMAGLSTPTNRGAGTPEVVAPPPARKTKTTEVEAPPTVVTQAVETPAPAPAVEIVKEEPKAEVKLDYAKDIGPRIAAIVAKGPEFKAKVVTLLGNFGVKSGRDLKPEQLTDFSAGLTEIEAV